MATNPIKLVPGVSLEYTPSFNEAAWQGSNLIRWSPSGLPEKIGGWQAFFPASLQSIVRALHAFEDLSAVLHLGVGAEDSLDVITGGALNDVTPQLSTDNVPVDFSTVDGSPNVTVTDADSDVTLFDVVVLNTPISVGGLILSGAYPVSESLGANQYLIIAPVDATATVANGGAVPIFTPTSGTSSINVEFPNHGESVGGSFAITIPVAVGGLIISGFYTVNAVVDADNFTINAANQATNSTPVTMNGGLAQIAYYITPGPAPLGVGFGIGPYGAGGYGTGIAPPQRVGTPITADDYTLDNWGGFLLANPDGGPIFVWQPNSGLLTAQMIAQAPNQNRGIFVSMPAQILVAYGSSVLDILDPLLINWSDAGQYTSWVAMVTNQAGSYRIPRGSAIVGGLQGPQYGLIWTDLAVWAMSYIGTPFVFSFNELATGCGGISKFGAAILSTTTYWISQKGFFALPAGGSVAPLPCTVWDFIFQNLDPANVSKIRAAPNSQFGEITWYFPTLSGNTGENDAYVKFTPAFSAWDYGFLGRSAWIDQSVFGPPIGADPTNDFIYQHELTKDAAGTAIAAWVESGYFAMNEAEDISFLSLVIPDMKWGFFGGTQSASVLLSFHYTDYPTDTVYTSGPFTVTSSGPNFITPQFRARLASVRIESDDLGSWWRLGALRLQIAPDGKL